MAVPFFAQKPFLKYYGLFVVLLLFVGIAWTAVNYFAAKEQGKVRWEYVAVPMSLPIIGLAGYALLLPFWFVYKAKQFQKETISRIPEMFSAPVPAPLPNGEIQYGDPDQVGYHSPEGGTSLVEIRFTNQRIVFTSIVDVRRLGTLYGLPAPDRSNSILLNEIRQCGFGLDERNPKHFVVIENTGNIHTFTSIVKFNAEIAFKELGWKRTQIEKYAYWIR